MNRVKALCLAVLAVVAINVMAATAAQATEGPYYGKCKGNVQNCPLAAERERIAPSLEIVSAIKAGTGNFILEVTGIKLEATALALKKGANIKGNAKGNAGTSLETIEFSNVTVTGNGEKCIVTSKAGAKDKKIVTEPLENWLDKTNEKSVKGENLLVAFKPIEKKAVFVVVKFEPEAGGKCTLATAAIELSGTNKLGVVAQAEVPKNSGEKTLELLRLEENEIASVNGALKFPATLIKTAFEEREKKVEKVGAGLTFAGKAVTKFTGSAVIEAADGVSKWGVFGF